MVVGRLLPGRFDRLGLGPALAGRPFLRHPEDVEPKAAAAILATADGAAALPRLGGMARPNGVVVVSGSITEHRSDRAAAVEHRAGDISREADGISHYWINHGSEPAVLLSSDVFNGK